MTMEPFWVQVSGPILNQGDYLPRCLVPVFGPTFKAGGETQHVPTDEYDLILVTQSCDLEQKKARLVAASPIYPIAVFEEANPKFKSKGRWNEVLKGRVEGLHLLASLTTPENNRDALVVDFREIYSLPFDYLVNHATNLGPRWR